MNDAIDPQPRPPGPSGPRGSPGRSAPADTSISRNARVEAIFDLALEHAIGDRTDFISAACGEDIELRDRVIRLLDAHDNAGTVFEEFGNTELELEFARLKPEEAGDRIGPYLLIEQIGEGGFGVVWKAEQDRPMKRKVALKIIKLGMDTRSVIARFEQERQALAFMNHPNIAKVLDAGATQQGRPYFVMELVLGAKITDYCDEIGVDIPGRLKLFTEVCHAVQHAHQKGIIHRDLKPSNILIALQDGRPVPKVIDFGVAKAIQQRLTELTIFTEVEQLIGTPLYMSPEQAEMSGVNIDTRTDIYALGVLLYELLIGRTPFDRHGFMKAGYDEMRRIIREVQPPIPSTALRTLAQGEAAEIAARRQTDTKKLVHAVSGDLDCIVMKALEKERARRYETANGFLLDVERLIRGEPISARPPSRLYRFSRNVRRNRLAYSAAALVLVSLVTGLAMTMHSRNREAVHRKLADQQRAEALVSARLAERLLYASDMSAAQDALRMNNLGRARMLLDEHRPKAGKEDLRAWEWRYLWELCRSKATHTLIRQPSSVLSVTFSADSKRIAACFGDGLIKIWDVESRRLTQEIASGLRLPLGVAGTALLSFSPQDSILVLATANGVNIYDLKTDGECSAIDIGRAVSGFVFSRDGRYLICRTTKEVGGKSLPLDFPELAVLDLSTRSPVAGHDIPDSMLTCGHGDIRFSANSEYLYTTTREGRQLGVAGFNRRRRISNCFLPVGEDDHLLSMDLSPDGKAAAVGTGWEKSEIQVWDTDRSKVKATLNRHTAYISDLAFSPTGNILASASGDQTVRLWDTQTWLEIGVLRGHGSEVSSIAFSADGTLLASGSKDGEILLWDSNSTTQTVPRFDFPADAQWVIPLPGRSAVKVQKGGRWSIWTLPSFAEATNLADYSTVPAEMPTSNLQIQSRDRRWDANLLSDGFVRIKDNLENRESILKGHLLQVNGLAFTVDARRLVTTSGGAEAAKIWDVQTGRELLNLRGRGGNLRYVYWTDDESALIVNSSTPGYSQAWIAPTWEQIASEEMVTGRWPSAQVHPSAITAKRGKSVRRTDKPIREPTGESINLGEKSLDDLTEELKSRLIPIASTGSFLNTQDSLVAYTVGAWQVWVGRESDYVTLSAQMLRLAAVFQGTGVRSRLVRLYCLRPSSEPVLLGEAVAIGRQAVSLAKGSGVPWHQLTLGMALYRRGEFDEAIEILTDAQRGAQNVPDQWAVVSISYLVQAMCQFHLKNFEAARVYLQRGAEKMGPVPLENENPFADGGDVNDLTVWIFYREARDLVEGEPVTSGD